MNQEFVEKKGISHLKLKAALLATVVGVFLCRPLSQIIEYVTPQVAVQASTNRDRCYRDEYPIAAAKAEAGYQRALNAWKNWSPNFGFGTEQPDYERGEEPMREDFPFDDPCDSQPFITDATGNVLSGAVEEGLRNAFPSFAP